MSRIGNRIINIPNDVTVSIVGNSVSVKGPKGELNQKLLKNVKVELKDNNIILTRLNDLRENKINHGTTNSLIYNMIIGVTKGYEKELEIVGVGYMVKMQENTLTFSLGFSHKINLEIPKNLIVDVKSNTSLKVSGIDKQLVGEFSSKIKLLKKPEPYGGKGIMYKGEYIRRKTGKKAA